MQGMHQTPSLKGYQGITMAQWTEFSCIIKPSPISGVGVFVTHDIPAGMILFTEKFAYRTMKTKDIPEEFAKFFIFLNEDECLCPERFDRMEIVWFINHSAKPNLLVTSKVYFSKLKAARDIKAGEELFIDYNQLNEPQHLKEDYIVGRART